VRWEKVKVGGFIPSWSWRGDKEKGREREEAADGGCSMRLTSTKLTTGAGPLSIWCGCSLSCSL
jgi:hypothetical protein